MDAVETFKVGNKTVKIVIDEDVESPRNQEYRDNCDTFIMFHKNYNLGDKHEYVSSQFNGWDEMEKQIIKDHKPVEMRRIFLYDHSGLTIADKPFSCPWDSGMIGFALISREAALKEMSTKKVTKKVKEWAKKYLDATISEYNSYIRGECFGYVVENEDGEHLDSCWGFIGDIDYVKKEATEAAQAIHDKTEDPNQLQLSFT